MDIADPQIAPNIGTAGEPPVSVCRLVAKFHSEDEHFKHYYVDNTQCNTTRQLDLLT